MDIKLILNNIKFKYRVSAIIINENNLLVSCYNDNKYCLPGGYVEIGETSIEAIKREIHEELRLNIINPKYIGIIENFFANFKGDRTHELDFYYLINISNNDAKNIDLNYIEHDKNGIIKHNFKWIKISELNHFMLVPSLLIGIIQNKKFNFHYIIKE